MRLLSISIALFCIWLSMHISRTGVGKKLLLMKNKNQKLMTEECSKEQLSVITFSWISDLNMSPWTCN